MFLISEEYMMRIVEIVNVAPVIWKQDRERAVLTQKAHF